MAEECILVVEDNPINRELLCDLLEVEGYTVLQATDGAEGIDIARRERPDLIFMDLQLPSVDGFAATGLLKRDPHTAHIPIIAVTAYAMKGDREKALEAGCDGYISKPFNTRELVSVVTTWLGKRGDPPTSGR